MIPGCAMIHQKAPICIGNKADEINTLEVLGYG